MALTFKGARVNAGYTQEQVCKEMGIAVSTLSYWENGKKFPNVLQAYKLAKLYGITLDDFLLPTIQV